MEKCRHSHVLWDWNGTLLHDVDWCIAQMNHMLRKRSMRTLASVSEYHAAFRFPVAEYYRNVGFDFGEEPFEALAKEFMELYCAEDNGSMALYADAERVLRTIHGLPIPQIVLSASAQDVLEMQLSGWGIRPYFDEILGISDIYAKSKLQIGMDWLSRNRVQNGVMVGDTVHDFEVSQAMGVACVLLAHGHQRKETLTQCGAPVFDHLDEVLAYLVD